MTASALVYEGYDPDHEGLREALTALGNGYIVTRGAAADALAEHGHYPGTYLAGGYDRAVTGVAGRNVENEDLVNLPNWLPVWLAIEDGPWLRPYSVSYHAYRHALDLERGLLERHLRFADEAGRITSWVERRLVSMATPHRAALEIAITPENWSGTARLRLALDGGVVNAGVARYRDLEGRHLETIEAGMAENGQLFLLSRTHQSRLEIALAARHRLWRDGAPLELTPVDESEPHIAAARFDVALETGQALRLEKVVGIATSRDRAIAEAGDAAREAVATSPEFEALLANHAKVWRHLWQQCDIELDVEGDHTQDKLRVHIFHLLQTCSPHTAGLDVGAPARGWHGEAYRGHIFWDELFIFPFFSLRQPILTRTLLLYRHRRLPAARRAAREAGLKGAMFPWQSGSSGREESQFLHLNPRSGRWIPDNSYRQRHVGAAIAFNTWHYYAATDDHEFMFFFGAELILEVARFWASLATYDPATGRYDIKGVMGPDEFHTAYPDRDPSEAGGLDNNAYTNVFATWVLMRALDCLELLPDERRQMLAESIGLEQAEVERFDDVSRRLKVPFVSDTVIAQFEGYERLEELDWAGYRAKYGDIQRLDRILEAEGSDPNRFKVSKQADVLMLFYLFSLDELELLFERLSYPFDAQTLTDTIDYYLGRTSHGSTLSWVVHSWVLARRHREHSWQLFTQALDSDIEDIQGGTTQEGIHLGAMAGTVDLIQRCYLGVELRPNLLHIDPRLPAGLRRVRTRLRYRRQVLEIDADHDQLRITAHQVTGPPVTIAYRGHVRELGAGQSCRFRLVEPLAVRRRSPCAPSNVADDLPRLGTDR